MGILLYILTAVIWGYIALEFILQKGIPQSISNSFYILDGIKKDLGYVFTLWCWAVAFMVIILMFELSPNVWFVNLAILESCFGLALVGAQPIFKKDKDAWKIHTIGAVLAGTGSIIASFLLGFWWVVVIVVVVWNIASIIRPDRYFCLGEIAMFANINIIIHLMLWK